jgi:hypothetical protein
VLHLYKDMPYLARDKHSSLLQTFVNYRRKKFYNIGPWVNVIKLFTALITNVCNELKCSWQAFLALCKVCE